MSNLYSARVIDTTLANFDLFFSFLKNINYLGPRIDFERRIEEYYMCFWNNIINITVSDNDIQNIQQLASDLGSTQCKISDYAKNIVKIINKEMKKKYSNDIKNLENRTLIFNTKPNNLDIECKKYIESIEELHEKLFKFLSLTDNLVE